MIAVSFLTARRFFRAEAWLLAVLLPLAPQLAQAADDDDVLADEQALEDEDDGEGVSLSYGVNLTSEYIDNGESLSNGNPALQGYAEVSYGAIFGGIWASTVDFDDGNDNVEFDLYAGVWHEFGDLELALSYVRYIYDQTGDCCGEIQLESKYEITDAFSTEVEFSWDPVSDATWTELGVAYSFAENWSLTSSVGTDFGTENEAEEEEEEADEGGGGRDTIAMELGLARQIGDNAELSVVYYNSNSNPEGIFINLALDF
jgi:uncharacterized protein (TIGR02001 family)